MINDLEQVLTAYETWLLQQPVAKNTRHAYRFHVRRYGEYLAGRSATGDDPLYHPCARDAAVCDYKHYLKTQRQARPTTINLALAAIDHLYLFLGLDGGKVQREDLPERSPRTLSAQEQRAFLRVTENSSSLRDRALAYLLFYTGLRLGECAALNVDDVVFAANEAFIVVRSDKGEIKRKVFLNGQAYQALEEWLNERLIRFPSPADPALFLNNKGKRLSMRAIDQVLREFGHEAKLDLSAYVLRHTCLSNLIRHGLDLKHVAQMAGYKRLETTHRYCLPQTEDRMSLGEEARQETPRPQRVNQRKGTPDQWEDFTPQRVDEAIIRDLGLSISQSYEQLNERQTQNPQAHPILLKTTLALPPLPVHWVARPRLTLLLQHYATRLLTVVSAPAGFGKTTLLREWVTSSRWPVAWFSLSRGENDPLRFLAYLIQAVQEQYPQVGSGLLPSWHLWQQPFLTEILAEWLNELTSLPQDITILLDHYKVITNPAVHELVQFLIEHLPPRVHLVIASRGELPFSLARLYAHGQAAELGARELCFTPEETHAFLRSATAGALSSEDLAMLEQRCEGWIAGLQVALATLQREDEPAQRLASTLTGNRHLQSYLLEEVLEQQPLSLQTFLLQTSLLDRFTASLCRAVTGEEHAQALLGKLEQAHLFICALEEEGWYRYHSLFAEALRSRLQHLYPDLVPQLYARASRWFEERGSIEEAINYALAGQEVARAAALIERMATVLLGKDRITTLQGWLAALPISVLQASPRLCITAAWLQLLTTQSADFTFWLDAAEEALEAREGQMLLGEIAAVRGEIVALRAVEMTCDNEFSHAIAACGEVLPTIPMENLYARSLVLLSLGMAYLRGMNVTTAAQLLSEASSSSHAAGHSLLLSWVLETQAEHYLTLGYPFQAMELLQQVLDLPDVRKGLPAGDAHFGLGGLFWEWNDLEAARRHSLRAWEIGMQMSNPNLILNVLFVLTQVSQAQGHGEEVNDWLEQTEAFIQKSGHFELVEEVERCRAWFALVQGRLEDALQWVRKSLLCAKSERKLRYEDEKLLQAEILIAAGRASSDVSNVQEALSLLEGLRARAESIGRTRMLIEVLVLQALALHLQGEVAEALCALERAVSLAEVGKYIRLFVDRGEPLAKLLRQLREQYRTQKQGEQASNLVYVRWLLAAYAQPASHRWLVTPGEGQPLLEPLSWRECQVLRLITAGKKNDEIARELVVVTGTVKAHINSIYRKLAVNNRAQAIARAHALQLL